MACLSHECHNPECDWWDSTNRPVSECPKCGAAVSSYFDEPPEHDEPDHENEEEQ